MNTPTALDKDIKEQYEADLVDYFGPKPINIFTRLRYMLELSHTELASRMYTTKISLIRLEAGCFDAPLPAALSWWLKESEKHDYGLSEGSIVDQYELYKDLQRKRHKHYFTRHPIVSTIAGAPHPLRQLRSLSYYGAGASVNEVAKSLCINQSTLNHWEKNWRSQKSVPKIFQEVLMSIGYSKYFVIYFIEAYDEWRANNK
jgi:hypothetical protein